MRNVIWAVRTAFCDHDLEFDEIGIEKKNRNGEVIRSGKKISQFCKKCGWHRSYWKF